MFNPNLTNNLIIGDPIGHSLSPKLHNYAYKILGLEDKFQFQAIQVKPEELKDFIKTVRKAEFKQKIGGITVTIPHKVAIMEYLDEIDTVAQKIGAVNTVVNDNGKLIGYNTDYLGTVIPLYNQLSLPPSPLIRGKLSDPFLANKTVALIGAGGAARAMTFGVAEKGANLVIFNRTLEKAETLARQLQSHFPEQSIECFADLDVINWQGVNIIINATSVGMQSKSDPGNINQSLIDSKYLNPSHIVFDAVYTPRETRLILEAKAKNCQTISGLEMFLYQAIPQFEYYTGVQAPAGEMREFLDGVL